MHIEDLLTNFINDEINLETFKYKLEDINTSNLFNTLNQIKDTSEMDKMMHAFLLIFFRYHNILNLSVPNLNPFFNYLNDILEDSIIETVEYIYIENNYAIIKMNDIYFFINNSNKFYKFKVLDNLKGKILYCLNCNDEFELKEFLKLPEYSFYALLDE